MSRYREQFPAKHTVLPVVHVESQDQAVRNVEVASTAGCDGAFLINHGMSSRELLQIHSAVAGQFPGFWLGLNCLDLHPTRAFEVLPATARGLWVDNADIDEQADEQPRAEAIASARRASGWDGLYFGGVAFKYQRPVAELEAAARIAARYMDVVTTSGPGTGSAADPEKITRMKAALGDVPLAIASGITPENVGQYLPVADCFLVATGISKSFTELDPARVRALLDAVRGA